MSEKKRSRRRKRDSGSSPIGFNLKRILRSRLFILGLIVFLLFTVLGVRLYHLQIIEGATKQEEYISQKTKRTMSLSSTRGVIYDRNGNVLAGNELIFVVNITDNGDYKNGYEKNLMLIELIGILDRHEEAVSSYVPIFITNDGSFAYNCSENARLGFLRDMYGKKSIDDLKNDTSGNVDPELSAKGVFDYLYKKYGIGFKNSRRKETYEIDDATALKLINLRYGMALRSYRRYLPTVAASAISQETIADVMEHADTLLGVSVDEDYRRVYTDSFVFSHLLGYTGTVSQEQIDDLNSQVGFEKYKSGDVVGQTGLEAVLELDLQGSKGEQTMYLDNLGHILEVTDQTPPESGLDYYLTVDRDLSVAAYHLIEQKLAGIILSKLVDKKVRISESMNNSDRKVSCYSVYAQFILNNLLDTLAFADAEPGSASARIYSVWQAGQERLLDALRAELLSDNPTPYMNLDASREDGETFMQDYMDHIYRLMKEDGYLNLGEEASRDPMYVAYHTEKSISLSEFIKYAITKNWVDTSTLPLDKVYTSTNEAFSALVIKVLESAATDRDFNKTIYRNLIWDDVLSPNDLCLAMLDQGILSDDEMRPLLEGGAENAAFDFIRNHIYDLTLTPAMLALDPCTAAATITDVNTGKVLACVSYPGYDNNRMSGTVDSAYYYQLLNDGSSPLYNTATLAQTAPGSVFKPCTALAALNTGVVTPEEKIETKGVYTRYSLNLSCWVFSTHGRTHGMETVETALRDSCNYFFCTMGERLSTITGSYSDTGGLNLLDEFAMKLGLGDKTGIELVEREPHLSDTSPIPSAIGQGSFLFSNAQLARYLDTLATRGQVHELSLLGKKTDSSGNVIEEYTPELVGTTDFSETSWDTVLAGMHRVVQEGSASSYFSGDVDVAGKTGSAEENKLRPNHANFISFAPFTDPEVGVTVSIPYGYTSANAVEVASGIYEYYYGHKPLEDILSGTATLKNFFIED